MLVPFFLILARVSGLFIGAPLLSRRGIPSRYRVAIALVLTTALFPLAAPQANTLDAVQLGGAFVAELAIGLTIGLLARFMLSAFQLAGSIIAFQMGFALANSFDPESESNAPVIGILYFNLAALLFLLVDGHHLLVRSLAASLEVIPIGSALRADVLTAALFASAADIYETGARIAGPVTGLMLLTNATVGLLNRVVPQLSIFNIGFPMTVFGGLVATSFAIPEVGAFFMRVHRVLEEQLTALVAG